jgi:hypothetical protein
MSTIEARVLSSEKKRNKITPGQETFEKHKGQVIILNQPRDYEGRRRALQRCAMFAGQGLDSRYQDCAPVKALKNDKTITIIVNRRGGARSRNFIYTAGSVPEVCQAALDALHSADSMVSALQAMGKGDLTLATSIFELDRANSKWRLANVFNPEFENVFRTQRLNKLRLEKTRNEVEELTPQDVAAAEVIDAVLMTSPQPEILVPAGSPADEGSVNKG